MPEEPQSFLPADSSSYQFGKGVKGSLWAQHGHWFRTEGEAGPASWWNVLGLERLSGEVPLLSSLSPSSPRGGGPQPTSVPRHYPSLEEEPPEGLRVGRRVGWSREGPGGSGRVRSAWARPACRVFWC